MTSAEILQKLDEVAAEINAASRDIEELGDKVGDLHDELFDLLENEEALES